MNRSDAKKLVKDLERFVLELVCREVYDPTGGYLRKKDVEAAREALVLRLRGIDFEE